MHAYQTSLQSAAHNLFKNMFMYLCAYNPSRRIYCRDTRVASIAQFMALIAMLLMAGSIQAQPTTWPADQDPLKNLRHEHPRLFRTADGFESLKKVVAENELYNEWKNLLESESEESRLGAPVTPPATAGQSIRALIHITLFGGLYKLDGDPRKAARARDEMLAAAAFPDWEPEAELTFGPMTWGMAVGYDWLYDYLKPEERTIIRTAIIEKGLKAGLAYYEKPRRWVLRNENHNQVGNSCMIVGALAVADENPEIARTILKYAYNSLQHSMPSFNPDGGWAEGPGYWGYGTGYLINAIAAMETAINTDMGLSSAPGFSVTGNFPMYATGPFRHAWNFSDGLEMDTNPPVLFWLARRFNHPEWAIHAVQMTRDRPNIFHLIHAPDEAPPEKMPANLPCDHLFRETAAACFRSAWDDPTATFLGFKAGHQRLGHWHLDVGSFVLDSQGRRWAIDLGPQAYSENYFGRERWTYFRAHNKSHNTLTINGQAQDPDGQSPIVAFLSTPQKSYAVADMSAAYKLPPKTLYRGAALLNRRDVLIQDDLKSDEPLDIEWNMYTRAKIVPKGRNATLALRGAKMYARLLSPADATFEIGSAEAPAGQTQQPDVHSLRIHLKTSSGANRIAVFLSPIEDAQTAALEPLTHWVDISPVK